MNYLQKLFINSVIDIYSDILSIDIATGECSYILVQNHAIEEVKLDKKWDEIKYMLLKNIDPNDHEYVLSLWEEKLTMDAEPDSAFGVNYHLLQGERRGNAAFWRMLVLSLKGDILL